MRRPTARWQGLVFFPQAVGADRSDGSASSPAVHAELRKDLPAIADNCGLSLATFPSEAHLFPAPCLFAVFQANLGSAGSGCGSQRCSRGKRCSRYRARAYGESTAGSLGASFMKEHSPRAAACFCVAISRSLSTLINNLHQRIWYHSLL